MANYSFAKYDTLSRWASYWWQIHLVLNQRPANVLEIGIGNKLTADYLKKEGANITTIDNNPALLPDIVGSVLSLPFKDKSFDVVLCCEVLEHLPFSDFAKALLEIKRVCKNKVILSLPHFGPAIKLAFKIPFLPEIKLACKIPFAKKHQQNEHFWEIGKRGYPLKKIKNALKEHFAIETTFVPFANQYHRFFLLKPLS